MRLSIEGGMFLMDGKPTYSDFPGAVPEALGRLMNSRMVQATFADLNPETSKLFRYPDGSPYDPERQTDEFIAALPEYKRYGVIAVTLNFQGGYPLAHTVLLPSQLLQPWENNAYTAEGALRTDYARRMRRAIEAADRLGMAVIAGLFYFGQNHRLAGEEAVKRAVREAVGFLAGLGCGNVLVEINNECDVGYVHPILQPGRVHELIRLAREVCGGSLPISTSYGGGALPGGEVLEASDFVLLHGNGQGPEEIGRMTAAVRAWTGKPIVFNEDSTSVENLLAAWRAGASWGYYDQGAGNYRDGFQSPPTNWAVNTPEKVRFFSAVGRLIRGEAVPDPQPSC